MVRLTDLEDMLSADASGQHRDELIDILEAGLSGRLEQCPEQVYLAAHAAREVIQTLWLRYHSTAFSLGLGTRGI
jgi:hypothetical protein